jgi:SAM-dependent methyltransferase
LRAVFDQTSDLYDLAYSHKDYAAEADWVRDAIGARVPGARTLLDVACGTGKHLEHLRTAFDCRGLEINPEFVAIAEERTGVVIERGDMDAFDLHQQFDAVTCLFSSIGYSKDLKRAFLSMSQHVAPGGVLIVEPWLTPDKWRPGSVQVLDHEDDDTRVVRMTASSIEGNVSLLEMHYLVASGSGIEHRVETHRMTLFTDEEYREAATSAGLSYELDQPGPFGRGAIIGRKPS